MIISSALVFVWYLQTKQVTPPKEVSFDAAMTQIRNKDIKEITVKQDTLELTNKSDVKYTAKLDASDATRDQIYAAAKETDTVIKLEAPSTGLGWLVLVNALPFILLMGFLHLRSGKCRRAVTRPSPSASRKRSCLTTSRNA